MKFNWGTAIAIVYTSFALIMVGMVVYSKKFDHSLVVDNYYEEDLAYQAHIDRLENSRGLEQDLTIQLEKKDGIILFQFPDGFQQLGGNIWFYRADDKSKDFKLTIEPDDEGKVLVPSKTLAPGLWKVKVNWEGNGTPFYKETAIVI